MSDKGLDKERGRERERLVDEGAEPFSRDVEADPSLSQQVVDAERDRFVTLVSHELRGPLATLTGYAQLLTSDRQASGALREKAAHSLLDQAKRLNFIIENLLQTSRLTSGRLRIEREDVDLGELVSQLVADQQVSPAHHIELRSSTTPIVGHWDRALVRLAITNLLSNAMKFSMEGGQILVELALSEGRATVRVSDQGIGIAPDDVGVLFQAYSRPARTEHFPGVGLGLFVAKGIIEAHGGEIQFAPAQGKGAVFTIILPTREASRTHGR